MGNLLLTVIPDSHHKCCDKSALIAVLLRAAYDHGRSVTIWIAKIPIITNGREGQLLCGSGAIYGSGHVR
jgi:hypothetical protein